MKCGRVYEYLGMTLHYREKEKLKVTMKEYTKKILDMFPEEIGKTASTPAADYLFQVRDKKDSHKSSEE